MSGLVVLHYPDGRAAEASILEKMTAALAHRGVDGTGYWSDGSTAFGHQMQWTTPESLHEHLPYHDPIRRLSITADARLDNRKELMNALKVEEAAISDSKLILLAYDRWNENCPEKLLGDFAFVIWDGPRHALFCARDPVGVKPLFYHHADSLFACASEIKALLCLAEMPRRLNEVRVADYLAPILHDKAITFYRGILRLPPGHKLTLDSHGLRIGSYWALDPHREIRLKSNDEYAEAFRELFLESVRARVRSAFPVGSLLSGGLDSSSIATVAGFLMKQAGQGQLHTISAVFDEIPECDEREFIQAALAEGDFAPHYVRADQLSPLADLDRVLCHEDEAFYTPNLFMHWGLYRRAQECGMRILLDGFDGDTTVSHGEAYLAELAGSGRWLTLSKELAGMARYGRRSWWQGLRRYAIPPLVPYWLRTIWRRVHGRSEETSQRLNPVIRKDFAERIGLMDRKQMLEGWLYEPMHSAREQHHRKLNWGVVSLALEVADRAAAAFFIEPRYPFFDRRLVEFCLALPPEQKLNNGWSRIIMRRAMVGFLPDAIRWRPGKSNLGGNFHHGLLTFDQHLLDEIILKSCEGIATYVDTDILRRVYQRYLHKQTTQDAMTIWTAVSLGLWLRQVELQP